MRIRNRSSYMESLPEGKAPLSPWSRLTRWLYLAILTGLVGYLAWLGISHLMYVHGEGQIEIEKTRISPLHGGRIVSLSVAEDSLVHKGQQLARIIPQSNCAERTDTHPGKLQFDIERKTGRLKLLKQRLGILPSDREQTALRRALEVDQFAIVERQRTERERDRLRQEMDELVLEVGLLRNELQLLEQTSTDRVLPAECREEVIVAPFEGRVHAVLRNLHEYVHRAETFILLRADEAPVRLEAYFDVDDRAHLQEGKLARVIFPDGNRGIGEISRIYSSAFDASERETVEYEPVATSVRVDLKPWTGNEERRWRLYDRLGVSLRIGQ